MDSVTNFAKSSTLQFLKSLNLNNIYYMEDTAQVFNDEPLTTKNAVKFLLNGTLKFKVCRYCLKVTSALSELDEILEIGINGALHEIAIKDMVASFHPVKVTGDANLPNKICKECLKQTMSSYLYVQQCERAERALRNCFDDIYDKLLKLDPTEPVKKRGKQKLHPNPNRIYTEHKNAIDYAEPLINIINTNSVPLNETALNPLECKKCWQVLPNVESLVNHEKSHPASMWYHCKLCGKSFVKKFHLKKHIKHSHGFLNSNKIENVVGYKCHQCDIVSEHLGQHLQHIEKHKFRVQFEHFMGNKMGELCAVCLNESSKMVNFNEMVYLTGGYPGLAGDQSIYNIISKTFTNISFDNYKGTKICDTCFNHALTSYIFMQKIQHVRHRLETCITHMLDNLSKIKDANANIMVEISQDIILPIFKYKAIDISLDDANFNESIEVLEDEFRLNSESESENVKETVAESESEKSQSETESVDYGIITENPAKNVTRTYINKKLNGYQNKFDEEEVKNICSEFLTFNKKIKPKRKLKCIYTCPVCNKHFVSDYFLKKHILKHVHRKVECTLCSKQFSCQFYLLEHMKIYHLLKSFSYVKCEICQRTFSNKDRLKSHLKCHINKECHLCNKTFKSQMHYDIHFQRHKRKFKNYKNNEQQTCSFCEKAYSNENELSLHVNKVHLQMKPYHCDMCENQYYTETNLNSHKKLHSLYSKETCTLCKKTFKCRKDLVVHVRKHIGIKPHQCPVCKQSFYSENNMKTHMKFTHGGKFCCRLCKTIVMSQNDLKDHINKAHSCM